MDRFLYDKDLRPERVKNSLKKEIITLTEYDHTMTINKILEGSFSVS